MTVLDTTPVITAVTLRGLGDWVLPFVPHILPDNEQYETDPLVVKNYMANNDQKYFVKNISGLEPPDRDIAIAATASGGKFQGTITAEREVVVLIGLNPDYDAGETPSFLRNQLYTLINTGYDPKIEVQLIASIGPTAYEYGYVSKFEADIFAKDPVVQITLTMLNWTFRSYSPVSYRPSDLSEAHPNIYNTGTAETGFQFAVKFTADMNGWFIKVAEDQSVGMVFEKGFNAGDVLAVSTIPGAKYVHWNKKRGLVKNKLDILTWGSEWIQLHPGMNHFVVPPQTGAWNWKGNLSFTPHYWGI